MGSGSSELSGPNLMAGIAEGALEEGVPFLGHAGGEAVVLVRRGAEVFAVGATCTHYSGPLAEGLVVGDEIRCPWHHACFSLRTGEVVAAPAMNPLPRWQVEVRDGMVFVTAKHPDADPLAAHGQPESKIRSVVIIGGGAAGTAAAEGLRREGYGGAITIVDPDSDAPYDRPNLSKDYLAGNAPEEWLPLRPEDFYATHDITRVVATAKSIDAQNKSVTLDTGDAMAYDALVLAMGAAPVRPPIPGAEQPHVHVLRTIADCRALIASAANAKRVVIAGASFIGMEAAAALRTRGVEVTVVAPELVPFSQVLGPTIGSALKALHAEHGVEFRLGRTVRAITDRAVELDDRSWVEADTVLLGIGVRPNLQLAEAAGVALDRGVVVNEYLETSVPGIYAAGDVARYPDARSDAGVRIEHWVVAQRQGAAVARNILGRRVPFTSIPFFWTQQYDMTINYVGHAEDWSHIVVEGSPEIRDCSVSFMDGEDLLAYVTIGRDMQSLEAERTMEA